MSSISGLAPEDYIEIQNLYAFYNQSSDAGDAEAFASLYSVVALPVQTAVKSAANSDCWNVPLSTSG